VLFLVLSLFSFSEIRVGEDVLKGIDKVYISVESLPKDAIEMGLTRERLRAITELKLRREGIKVECHPLELKSAELIPTEEVIRRMNVEEMNEFFKTPILYINVAVKNPAFSITVKVTENVTLRRDEDISCAASTWQRDCIGVHTNNLEYIVSGLSLLLDLFLIDYYKANPKENKRGETFSLARRLF